MTSSLPLGLRPADLLSAAVTGVLTVPDPARRTRAGRWALRSALAGFTGATMWAGLGREPELGADLRRRAGVTAGAVALVYATAPLGERLDAVVQRALVRRGVRRPRAVMAVGGAGLALATAVLDRRVDQVAAARREEETAPRQDRAAAAGAGTSLP